MAANPPAWRNPWEKVGHGRAKTNKTVPSSHKGKQQLQQKMWASHGKEESSCEFHEQQKKQRWRTHSSMWRLSSFEKQEEGKKKSGEWRKTVIKTERNEQGLRISEHKERSSKNYARGSATIENNGKKHLVVKNNDSKLTVWGTPRVASIPIATVNKSNTSSSSSSNSSKKNKNRKNKSSNSSILSPSMPMKNSYSGITTTTIGGRREKHDSRRNKCEENRGVGAIRKGREQRLISQFNNNSKPSGGETTKLMLSSSSSSKNKKTERPTPQYKQRPKPTEKFNLLDFASSKQGGRGLSSSRLGRKKKKATTIMTATKIAQASPQSYRHESRKSKQQNVMMKKRTTQDDDDTLRMKGSGAWGKSHFRLLQKGGDTVPIVYMGGGSLPARVSSITTATATSSAVVVAAADQQAVGNKKSRVPLNMMIMGIKEEEDKEENKGRGKQRQLQQQQQKSTIVEKRRKPTKMKKIIVKERDAAFVRGIILGMVHEACCDDKNRKKKKRKKKRKSRAKRSILENFLVDHYPLRDQGIVRPYCQQILCPCLNEAVVELLTELHKFQQRMHLKAPTLAKRKKRYVCGMREVMKCGKRKKLKHVIMAPYIEPVKGEGGLDSLTKSILDLCKEEKIQVTFALNRKNLGKTLKKKSKISMVGILDPSGANDQYFKMSQLARKKKEQWQMFHNDQFYQDPDFLRVYTGRGPTEEKKNAEQVEEEEGGKGGKNRRDGRDEIKHDDNNDESAANNRRGRRTDAALLASGNIQQYRATNDGDDDTRSAASGSSSSRMIRLLTTTDRKKGKNFMYNPHVKPFVPAIQREEVSSTPTDDGDEESRNC